MYGEEKDREKELNRQEQVIHRVIFVRVKLWMPT